MMRDRLSRKVAGHAVQECRPILAFITLDDRPYGCCGYRRGWLRLHASILVPANIASFGEPPARSQARGQCRGLCRPWRAGVCVPRPPVGAGWEDRCAAPGRYAWDGAAGPGVFTGWPVACISGKQPLGIGVCGLVTRWQQCGRECLLRLGGDASQLPTQRRAANRLAASPGAWRDELCHRPGGLVAAFGNRLLGWW